MKCFSAVLLFQFRKVGSAKKRRLCELRIITFKKRSAGEAFAHAQNHRKAGKVHWVDSDGKKVYREFLGVAELMEIGIEAEAEEVWWDLCYMTEPKKRKRAYIPAKRNLRAFARKPPRRRIVGTLRLNPLY